MLAKTVCGHVPEDTVEPTLTCYTLGLFVSFYARQFAFVSKSRGHWMIRHARCFFKTGLPDRDEIEGTMSLHRRIRFDHEYATD